MKLSVSMWSVVSAVRSGRMDLPGFIEFAAGQQANGAQGVELLDYFWRDCDAELPAVKQQIADAGLSIAAYSIGNDFAQPDDNGWTQQVEAVKRAVDVANRLETDVVRVFSGNAKPDMAFEQALGRIVDGLAAGAEYAQGNGVTLALENHGLMAGRSDQVRQIITAVNSPGLRANIDTGNFLLVGQEPTEAVRELADLAALVHLKDFRLAQPSDTEHVYRGLDGTAYTGAVVGEGLVDLRTVVELLRSSGYAGWLSLEFEGGQDPLTIGVPASLQAAHRLLG